MYINVYNIKSQQLKNITYQKVDYQIRPCDRQLTSSDLNKMNRHAPVDFGIRPEPLSPHVASTTRLCLHRIVPDIQQIETDLAITINTARFQPELPVCPVRFRST